MPLSVESNLVIKTVLLMQGNATTVLTELNPPQAPLVFNQGPRGHPGGFLAVALAELHSKIPTNIPLCRYNIGMRHKVKTSITLSIEALRLLSELAKKLGLSKTGVLEMIIRKFAKLEEVE